tara:strand:+ start:8760 stop:9116 length:357 start_codon:yes stop_codon:yes gene_type:complete
MYNYFTNLTYRNYDDDEIYRQELLNCFNLEEYTDDINLKIKKLYEIVKEHYSIILQELKKNKKIAFFKIEDDFLYFTFLFSWDYFYENHEFIKSIYSKSNNYEKTKTELISKLTILNK